MRPRRSIRWRRTDCTGRIRRTGSFTDQTDRGKKRNSERLPIGHETSPPPRRHSRLSRWPSHHQRLKMKRSLAPANAASSSPLGIGRLLCILVKARPSRVADDATTVSPCPPNAASRAPGPKKRADRTPRLNQRVGLGGEASTKKVHVSLRFDVVLLARVSESAKQQGIIRTSWLHRAAFDALGNSRINGA